MARDIEWITRKGKINIKALTQKAKDVILHDMGITPGIMFVDAGVFMMAVMPHDLDQILLRLRAAGLSTEDDQAEKDAELKRREAELKKLTEF